MDRLDPAARGIVVPGNFDLEQIKPFFKGIGKVYTQSPVSNILYAVACISGTIGQCAKDAL